MSKKKISDTKMLDWVLSRGWVHRMKKKRAKKFENDTFIRRVDSREVIQRLMSDAALSKSRTK